MLFEEFSSLTGTNDVSDELGDLGANEAAWHFSTSIFKQPSERVFPIVLHGGVFNT
ncbi:hypothetical protein [Glutamicibacter creatinolyticus]|uniref:hypothetical protein n=1 Tax=Glutamicibacter creatinolyticus TaxID=162496 RepID=UPI003217F6B4